MPTRSKARTSCTTFQPSSTVAEHVGLGDPHVVEEDLVEVVRAEHARDRPHLDAGSVHRHQEDGDALLLLLAPRRAGEQEAPLRHGGVGRPDLLAADAPPVAVPPGGRLQRRQVGSGVGLAEPLAPDHLTGGDGREVEALLLVGAVAHERRADPVHPHVLRAPGLVVGPHLLAHRRLLPGRGVPAAELVGPGRAQQALGGQQAAERLRDLEVGGVVGEGAEVVGRARCRR